MLRLLPYDRRAAVAYAHRWAFGRNPAYYSFDEIGGDCTNFASQCLYAGAGVMNFTPVFGWYYIDAANRAPAWTGVPFFWNFMTRAQSTQGPVGVQVPIELLQPGDCVQLRFQNSGEVFAHTPVVVSTGETPTRANVLVAAHSNDADYRPLNTYENVTEMRFLHIIGVLKEVGGGPEEASAQINGEMDNDAVIYPGNNRQGDASIEEDTEEEG